DNIVLLKGRVTLRQIRDAFRELANILQRDQHPPAICLIYVSTHGHILETQTPGQVPRRDLILLASDSRVTETDAFTALDGLTRSKFESYISVLPVTKKVIILDACYSGAVSLGSISSSDIYQPTDAAVLASSRLSSRFNPKNRNSEFTRAV